MGERGDVRVGTGKDLVEGMQRFGFVERIGFVVGSHSFVAGSRSFASDSRSFESGSFAADMQRFVVGRLRLGRRRWKGRRCWE